VEIKISGYRRWCWGWEEVEKKESGAENNPQNSPKIGPKKRARGPPGRGVLRFWGGGIQESRSYFSQKRAKNQKSGRFRG